MIYYQEPNQTLYCGHVLEVLRALPAESVDMVLTSPPYWGLRTYKTEPQIWGDNLCEHEWGDGLIKNFNAQQDNSGGFTVKIIGRGKQGFTKGTSGEASQGQFCLKCNAWRGELGLEPTIELYISHLLQIFDEVKRVLKKTGTCWVNIGDSYAGSGKASGQSIEQVTAKQASNFSSAHIKMDYGGILAKSLCGIPERFVLGMQDRGWIRRNSIIWYKKNPMPESVKDRFTEDFEYLFFFSKQGKYYFEQQFEPHISTANYNGGQRRGLISGDVEVSGQEQRHSENINYGLLGRNKRCVWEINTEPYPEAHFATFPEKLCETPILAGCPIDGTVLDPFCGSGTVMAVAKKLGRKAIGIDLQPKYCDLTVKRLQKIPLPFTHTSGC